MVMEDLTGGTDEHIQLHPVASLVESHHLANMVGEQVKALGLDPTHVAHGLITEAMMQLLGVDLLRADELARGFVALAVADQA
ncbi:hypothetical protein C7G41_21270 [Bradyrhizobium sp. MOS002]|nr:hypothetical protein C7G41_21270 [Bradyrhizobium sp. MOS002]